jgi:hypothetical protein
MKNTIRSSRLYAGGIFICLLSGVFRGMAQQEEPRLLINLSGGYQRQDFRWSIAGNSSGQEPNVYSELKWRGVSGPTGAVDLHWKAWKRWRVFASGSRVFTRSGTMTDTDYGLDNRHDILYQESFPAIGGYDEALTAGIGYCVCCSGPFKLTSYLGYGIDAQYFPITDPGGPYDGLNSSYSGKWWGPMVRAEGSLALGRRWQVVANAAYHQVIYHGWADWNLIPTFAHPVSYRHTADGYGVEADAGLRYFAGRKISLEATGGYFNWQTGTGIDQLYLSTGSSDQTQLNGVVREGWRCNVGIIVEY